MARSDKTPKSDSQQLLAQVIEEPSNTTRSEDKPVGTLGPEKDDLNKSEERRQVNRDELGHVMSEEPATF